MVSWPELGTRVAVRYRRPDRSVPPLTDVIGHLLAITPLVRVQTKTGAAVEFSPADVVAVRALSDAPVRVSEIRALEHAAALAWPGVEQHWLDGWLLRAGYGVTHAANSAVPIGDSADPAAIPAIADWYRSRVLTPRLAVADRLLRITGPGERANRMLVRNVHTSEPDRSVRLSAGPTEDWFRLSRCEIPVDVLTAVVQGVLTFGTQTDVAAARAAVTDAPDGTRWVGLSVVGPVEPHPDASPRLCAALLAWGASLGATRGYFRVHDDDAVATELARSLGFVLHHRARYVTPTT